VLVIRLQRVGRKNRAEYRVVVAEKSRAVKKKFVEILGHYLPTREPKVIEIDTERALYWIGNGAKPSARVASLLKSLGLKDMEQYFDSGKRQRSKKKEDPEAEQAAPTEDAAPAEGESKPEAEEKSAK